MYRFNTLKALPSIRQCRLGLLKPSLGLTQTGPLFTVFQLDNQVAGSHGIINIEGETPDRTAGLGGHRTLLYRFDDAVKMHGLLQHAAFDRF